MRILAVHTSFSNKRDAVRVSRTLVEEELAACANILPAQSIYRWKENIEEEDEVVVILKTREETYQALEERLLELHPYEVPMIVAFRVQAGSKDYLAWLDESLAKEE